MKPSLAPVLDRTRAVGVVFLFGTMLALSYRRPEFANHAWFFSTLTSLGTVLGSAKISPRFAVRPSWTRSLFLVCLFLGAAQAVLRFPVPEAMAAWAAAATGLLICYSWGKIGCWRMGCCSAPEPVLALSLPLFEAGVSVATAATLIFLLASSRPTEMALATFFAGHGALRLFSAKKRGMRGLPLFQSWSLFGCGAALLIRAR